ncbi:S41 family peptidase [Aquimarina pacifica]|uniref:S41 family peptidase n=1 Tax=Aquimarina pacifica TaxID=1296415 RepID=UPI00047271D8|nr:S41 family peptidase [Aquimarina pacifica]
MKTIRIQKLTLALFIICCCTIKSNAQKTNLTQIQKDSIINTAATYLTNYYVFKELGEKTASYLKDINSQGHFNAYNELESFASELTKVIYTQTYDKHITVDLKPTNQIADDELSRWIESRMDERNYFRKNNGNFKTIKKLHGNVGYLELRGFYGLAWGEDFANYTMEMLSTSDAIIIDLRSNYGGRGDMTEHLLSYFFEKPVPTSKSLKREGDEFIETLNYTKVNPENKKMYDIPLFILTSKATFSAAEAFAYPLKIHKRATIIGEITRGGGNAGDIYSLSEDLNIFIPDVSVSHPTEKESWEGVGIEPDINTRSGDAFDVALALAQKAAEKFKVENDKKARGLLETLRNTLSDFEKNPDPQTIIDIYLACREQNLIFEDWEINSQAYLYAQNGKTLTSMALFKSNTILNPESASVFYYYGEALLKNNEIAMAITNYKKAVSLGEKYKHRSLSRFKNKLEEVREQK